MKDTYVDGEKLVRNGRKTATYFVASFLTHYNRVLFLHLLVFCGSGGVVLSTETYFFLRFSDLWFIWAECTVLAAYKLVLTGLAK